MCSARVWTVWRVAVGTFLSTSCPANAGYCSTDAAEPQRERRPRLGSVAEYDANVAVFSSLSKQTCGTYIAGLPQTNAPSSCYAVH